MFAPCAIRKKEFRYRFYFKASEKKSKRFKPILDGARNHSTLIDNVRQHFALRVSSIKQGNITISLEGRTPENDRRDQNAQCPDVRRHRVRMILHEDLRRSVGQRVDGEGHTIGGGEDLPRETKVGQKDVVIVCHQKVIEFDVTVNDITTMEEVEDFHDLVNVNTKNLGRETMLDIKNRKLRWEQLLFDRAHDSC